ncbi:hypothetical protein [Kitasatospora cheerisanensis]|uniref:Uncharacterized protein n=1 Tax=Kitasatospora cheerisanensis KCTC 2395 TaxID=1348663 RepID=A0A066YT16_9ACTN|nr:hypothetical protein [Kitasatospora cheerisanensis]KDN84392.1 hypothetical protein KCH_41830 [Kitasatospora cheerisanensis KCTC 2395]
MTYFELTHAVTRAGAAFGFSVAAVTAMILYFSRGRSLSVLKDRAVWLPWTMCAVTMILASAVTGGFIGQLSGTVTGAGNSAGQQIGHAAVGQDGAGAVKISTGEVLSYPGCWLVLVMIIGVGLFLYHSKGWGERLLGLSGAVTGATWGIASSVGGWAAAVGVPLVSWLAELVIG